MAIHYDYEMHPSFTTVDGSDKPALRVLEDFQPDRTLPKYRSREGKVILENGKEMTLEEYLHEPDHLSSYRRGSTHPSKKRITGLIPCVKAFFESLRRKTTRRTFVTIKELVKRNVLTQEIMEIVSKGDAIVAQLKTNGQYELATKVETILPILTYEVALVQNGITRYLTEDDLIKVFKKADVALRLDFLENYPEALPVYVAEKKKKTDELKIFDNYVVLHYDPAGKALKSMKEEEKRRDPILFGMITGSRRFYYIIDWTIGKDDITLAKVCEILNIKDASRVSRDIPGSGDIVQQIIQMPYDTLNSTSNYVYYQSTAARSFTGASTTGSN